MEDRYQASIKHSEETVRIMARAQYETFRPMAYYWLLLISLILLAVALFVPGLGQSVKILCILLGSFTLVGLNSPARQLADQVIRSLNGKFPTITYYFEDELIRLKGTDNADSLPYNDIYLLLEQKDYLYLFLKDHSSYMLDRSSITPNEAGLMALISEKTGLPWTKNRSILNTSIKSLKEQKARQSGR